MGDHIHPPFEGMWASSARSEIHITINPPRGLSTLGNHIHPLLEGTWKTPFDLQRRESIQPPTEGKWAIGKSDTNYYSTWRSCIHLQ